MIKITPPIDVAIFPNDFLTLLPIDKPNKVKIKLQIAKETKENK